MKAKRIIKGIIITILCVILTAATAVGVFFVTYKATVSFDFSEKTGAVMKGASGYLYGIAEEGVPSAEMVESIDVQTIAQKVPGGLQHPIGGLDAADKLLGDVKYEVVYLQDMYDTWYYKHDDIMELRSKGKYDYQKFLDSDYLPKVEKKVKELSNMSFKGTLVYCLYNECDNGIWFGETQKDENPDNKFGVWCDYNETGKNNFNNAWKQTWELVKSIDKNAVIGGPGYCDFDVEELRHFLTYCRDNSCLPDVMIYHELAEREAFYFDDHIREYRALESELGIKNLPIVITEYGMMSENGCPGEMIKYISQFETNKVYGDNAYWRLADNLNDTCADTNVPNAEWWLMRWYTDMKGETVAMKNKDILSSDFANYFKYHRDELSFNGFTGIASLSDSGDEIDIVCGGGERKSRVVLDKLDSTALDGKEVEITVEQTVYQGLYGEVFKPEPIKKYTATADKRLVVDLGKTDPANAYHITVRPAENTDGDYNNDFPTVRYEFESGRLIGSAYTYRSYAPASGGNKKGDNLVGGMEKKGDGVEIDFDVPADGEYNLTLVYGNSNDGEPDENGRQSPDDRVDTQVYISVDGDRETAFLPNTIKSEYTSSYRLSKTLKKGSHTLRVEHGEGTYVLDSLLVKADEGEKTNDLSVLKDDDRSDEKTASFLVIAPTDFYVTLTADAEKGITDGAEFEFKNGSADILLKRGLNFVDVPTGKKITLAAKTVTGEHFADGVYYETTDFILKDGAKRRVDGYIDNIGSNGGSAELEFTAERKGNYRLILEYSNNDEGGVHDYNVDLIERYITVGVNGKKAQNVWCRSTYSWQTKNTVSVMLELEKGKNTISLSNDGAVKFNSRDAFAPHIYSAQIKAFGLLA